MKPADIKFHCLQHDKKDILEVSFAVLGAVGAGKSSFVQRALDLKRPATLQSWKKMSFEGDIFLVNLVEVQIKDIGITSHEQIQWPPYMMTKGIHSVDGILVIYDVTDETSILRLPETISE